VELLGKYSNKSRTAVELRKLLEMTPEGAPPRRQPHIKRRRPSQRQSEEIAAAYQQGATYAELGRRYGMQRQTISRAVERAGVRSRYRLIGPDELALATAMYEAGQSSAAIAAYFGVAPGTVRWALRSAGVPIRDTHGRY
jgi:DNA invertase Pin-like site-specific DNA recombinase